MVKTQGKIAMEGDLTPSAYHMLYSIPLVKSDGKLQPENPVLTAPGFPYALPFRTMDFPASAPIIISITILFRLIPLFLPPRLYQRRRKTYEKAAAGQ